MPTSPSLIVPAVAFAAAVMMAVQSSLERRSWWERGDDVWGALLVGLTIVLPIVVAVVWPRSLWPWLPPLAPTALSFMPIVLAWWCVKRWHRYLWKRQRPQLGPFKPVPRINKSDSQGF